MRAGPNITLSVAIDPHLSAAPISTPSLAISAAPPRRTDWVRALVLYILAIQAVKAQPHSGMKKAVSSSTAGVAKKGRQPARAAKETRSARRAAAPKRTAKPAKSPLQSRIKEARKLEAIDRAAAKPAKRADAHPLRNDNFPETYIAEISVKLDDPDHPVTLRWTGPRAAAQEAGPFRASPGAGLKGLNCDLLATSRRSGSKCTPKGTFTVSGFQSSLNSDSRATFVTWFVRSRGIALHYFPSVPKYAASHGCVRLEKKSVAQLIQSNSRAGLTTVVIDGTWTRPPKQW